MIPEYDVVVIDEAHELSARVTQAATDELSVPEVERAARRAQRHVEGTEADDLADAAEALRAAFDDYPAGPHRPADHGAVRRAAAGPRRGPRADLRVPQGVRRGGGRPGPHAGPRLGAGDLQERRADGRRLRRRRAVAGRARAQPGRRPALRGAAAGVGTAARQAAGREDRGAHQRHPDARRRLRLGGHLARPQAQRARRPLAVRGAAGAGRARRGRRALARDRRRLTVRLPPPGHPVRRPAPAPARPRRAGRRPDRRDRRPGRRRRRAHPRPVLQPAGRRGGGGGDARAAAAPDHPGPGRGAAARAGPAVRRGPARLPVRHAQPLAGPRRARATPASWC